MESNNTSGASIMYESGRVGYNFTNCKSALQRKYLSIPLSLSSSSSLSLNSFVIMRDRDREEKNCENEHSARVFSFSF